jgi:hypothetical protein
VQRAKAYTGPDRPAGVRLGNGAKLRPSSHAFVGPRFDMGVRARILRGFSFRARRPPRSNRKKLAFFSYIAAGFPQAFSSDAFLPCTNALTRQLERSAA